MGLKDYLRTVYYSYEDPIMYVQEFRRKTKITLALPNNMSEEHARYRIDKNHIIVYTIKTNAFGNSAKNNYSGSMRLKNIHRLEGIKRNYNETRNWFIVEIPKDPYYTIKEVESKSKKNKN